MSKKKCNFAAKIINRNSSTRNFMSFTEFWTSIKIAKWGKYVVTLLVFLIVFLFIGEQSVVHFISRGREIKHLEEQRDMYREGSEKAMREIQTLNNPDSLERYAREHYYMHAGNEDIFLVEEE